MDSSRTHVGESATHKAGTQTTMTDHNSTDPTPPGAESSTSKSDAVPPATKLPEIDSPPPEQVLEDVPSKEEIIEQAQSADEIVGQQPSPEELLRGRRASGASRRRA